MIRACLYFPLPISLLYAKECELRINVNEGKMQFVILTKVRIQQGELRFWILTCVRMTICSDKQHQLIITTAPLI